MPPPRQRRDGMELSAASSRHILITTSGRRFPGSLPALFLLQVEAGYSDDDATEAPPATGVTYTAETRSAEQSAVRGHQTRLSSRRQTRPATRWR